MDERMEKALFMVRLMVLRHINVKYNVIKGIMVMKQVNLKCTGTFHKVNYLHEVDFSNDANVME